MDFSTADMKALAPQLRKPEGELGREAAKVMARKNNEAIAFTLDCLAVKQTDRVLEIGFGPGEGIAQTLLLAKDGCVSGIDFSPDMLAMAEERNRRAVMQEQAELTLGEAAQLPYEDAYFDKIFAVNVFHFWTEPARELAECFRVLRPGGRIAFFMAYPASWRPGIRESGVFVAREPRDVERELTAAGFTEAESRDFSLGEFRGFVTMGCRI